MPNTWVTYGLNTSDPGSTSNSVGLSGLALADNNLSWNFNNNTIIETSVVVMLASTIRVAMVKFTVATTMIMSGSALIMVLTVV
jgi:outer membrane usher protein FimD/PapC